MDLHDYLRILRQRWVLVAVVAAIAVGAAVAWTAAATPQYRSTTQLYITTPQESTNNSAYQGGLFSQERVKSYVKLISGQELARRVVEALGIDEDPRDLTQQITAEAEPSTVVLSISVTDESPERARQIARMTAKVFVEYVDELETPKSGAPSPVKASIVDDAILPLGAFSPDPKRNLALALVVGLLGGFGLAILRDMLDVRVRSADDVAEATGDAPSLGNIPFVKQARSEPLTAQLPRHAPRAEAFRVLATNLRFIDVDSDSKVFVVSSAVPEEGKSVTACNLAIALAEMGNRVLLIEADLRRPKVAEYMGLASGVGLSTVLIRRAELKEALQRFGTLEVLTSGKLPPNPTGLVQSAAMEKILAEAREKFDYVIVDAPPLLPIADAALLAQQTDGAILVVRHGSTTRHQVRTSAERLQSVGAVLLGTITNMTPSTKRGNGSYGYGYGYGYAPDAVPGGTHTAKPAEANPSADAGEVA